MKQLTRCIIVLYDGTRYEETNRCDVDGLDVCPRVTAGSVTGEGYELCGSTHAEANAAALVPEGKRGVGGMAFLFGHDWFCRDCQHALSAVGVGHLILTQASA